MIVGDHATFLPRQTKTRILLDLRQIFCRPHPADIAIRADQHIFTFAAIRRRKMTKCILRKLPPREPVSTRRNRIDAFHAAKVVSLHPIVASEQAHQCKVWCREKDRRAV